MKLKNLFLILLTAVLFSMCKQQSKKVVPENLDLNKQIGQARISDDNILKHDDYFTWGGSVVKEDNKYHMFYARWPHGSTGRTDSIADRIFLGFSGWLKYSEIAYAVSDNPNGPFKYVKTIVRGSGDSTRWDYYDAHNPHIKRFNGKIYLYYIANNPLHNPENDGDAWRKFVGGQKIGFIKANSVADLVNGDYEKCTEPIVAPDNKKTFHRAVNPSVTQAPDGTYLMMFKSSSQRDGRGHMTHWIAQADSPEGPFKLVGSVFTEADYAAEDPYFWFDKKRNKFFAIVKDFSHSGKLTSQFGALGLITSADGITNWKPAEKPLVSLKQIINWKGDTVKLVHLERPQLLLDNDGQPLVLYAAASVKSPFAVKDPTKEGKPEHNTFNVQIPIDRSELSWEELREQYEFPKWYTEARFGIWAHWGAQTEPEEGGGWYARHMYMQDVGTQLWGAGAYPYHNKTYGHPSEKGFKDVIHEWKAENLDTDALLKYFKSLGAKYFMVMANHHDHFDNFNSTHHPWNSVNVGPKRDIVAEFEKSSKKYGIPFGVSSHDDRFLNWWLTAFGADTSGVMKGVPYDGHMTKEDGIGKWWEGLDPADLYGLPPEKRTPEWVEQVKYNWMLRHKELATKYDIDMLWFDGYGFPYNEYGKEVCRTYYNHSLRKHGKNMAVVAGKFHNEPSTVKDIERGGSNEILPYPWQGIITFGSWFYKKDKESRHNARTVIEMMTDIISKNGNLLLNVELLPDGTVPADHKIILDEVGEWVNLNSEAIYASKPWKVYGDNLNSYLKHLENEAVGEADLEALKKQTKSEHFNERTVESLPYGPEEVRFTTKGKVLYIFVLNPEEGEIELPALGLSSEYAPKKIKSIRMLGDNSKIEFKQNSDKLILNVPAKSPNKYTVVFVVKGAL